MTTETMLFLFATVVILLSIILLSGTYLYLYFRDKKMVRIAKSSVEGTVVGYSSFKLGNPPIVEYVVDGTSYRKSLQYFIIKTVSLPWGPLSASDKFTKEDMLANSLTLYRNSFISFNNLMRTHFPIYSKMTVWYDSEKPTRAYVERYCGINKLYKWLGIGSAVILIMMYVILVVAYLLEK